MRHCLLVFFFFFFLFLELHILGAWCLVLGAWSVFGAIVCFDGFVHGAYADADTGTVSEWSQLPILDNQTGDADWIC